ncbi:unnamed protein product [Lathyrus oleraceus]|uniref:Uncharacterized protein n=1 Tax=Pisum sativum TaxID=3888 RepID=A0A9D5BPX1_PEA|nr:uncharacterized protein LOC127079362 [Pisum sativum]KAI5447461.1 hypothetical protein KIW84_015063 [Pisum sativum]
MFSYLRLCHNPNLTFIKPSPILHLLLQPFSSSANHSFTLNYLIQNLAFSPETASKISTKLLLNNSQNPDSVLALFKSHGFSNSQLSTLIKTCPNLLTYHPNKTLLPKLNFLLQKGASTSDLIDIITKNPRILYLSLQNSIIPFYDLVKRFFLSDESTIASLKVRSCMIYSKTPSQNIQLLLQNGVPESKVGILFRNWYTVFTQNPPVFEKVVMELKELGFNPKTTFFTVALRAKINSKSNWENKIDVYKKWGWSQEDIVSAFLKHPWCMLASVDKIEAVMKFFVDHIGWESLVLAKHPILIMMSLEKRVIPRAFVLKFLESKGLVKDAKLARPFKVSEDVFLKKFVNCFEEEASNLLKLYEEKREVSRNV